jgi:hypothetical protein
VESAGATGVPGILLMPARAPGSLAGWSRSPWCSPGTPPAR